MGGRGGGGKGEEGEGRVGGRLSRVGEWVGGWGARIEGGGPGDEQDLVLEALSPMGLKLLEEMELWQVVKLWPPIVVVKLRPPIEVVKLWPPMEGGKLWPPMKVEHEGAGLGAGRMRRGGSALESLEVLEGAGLANYQVQGEHYGLF